mmetsp:Transcript_13832/g.39610  ORF Transcript_13832/g.39610 Transcript_13832/m.39610 type:complete len:147 (+) Transcript_13832:888-1328(+)
MALAAELLVAWGPGCLAQATELLVAWEPDRTAVAAELLVAWGLRLALHQGGHMGLLQPLSAVCRRLETHMLPAPTAVVLHSSAMVVPLGVRCRLAVLARTCGRTSSLLLDKPTALVHGFNRGMHIASREMAGEQYALSISDNVPTW